MELSISRLLAAMLVMASCQSYANKSAPAELYEVAHVADSDTLNARIQPGVKHEIVFMLDSRASDLKVVESRKVSGADWVRINWYGKYGWVNSYYLQKRTDRERATLYCSGTEPFWSVTVDEQQAKVDILGDTAFTLPVGYWGKPHNSGPHTRVINAKANERSLTLIAELDLCNDGMSERLYEYSTIFLLDSNQSYSGCCVMR